MEVIADLHIHSHFSIATGREADLEHLDLWGRYKGLQVVGTGDCTHPQWLGRTGRQTGSGGAGRVHPQTGAGPAPEPHGTRLGSGAAGAAS